MCKNSKKFGKKAVPVAIAAILGAAVLATGVAAEDVKPSYDTAYLDADQAYFDWFERTGETLVADMTFLDSALNDELKKGGDMDNIYKWSKELEHDATNAIVELKQFDDVSPELREVINRDKQRYIALRRAGSYCGMGATFQSKECFDDYFYNLNSARHHNEEWNNLVSDYHKDLIEYGVEKSQELSKITTQTKKTASQTGSQKADKDTCSGIYDDIEIPGRFGDHEISQESSKITTQTKKTAPATTKKSSQQPAQVVTDGKFTAFKSTMVIKMERL